MGTLSTSHTIDISVNGTTMVAAGDCVELVLPEKAGQNRGKTPDRFFQGPFLIQSIQHTFSMSARIHTMDMTLQKDSVLNKFISDDDHIEPKPTLTGEVFRDTDFYDLQEQK